MPGRVFNGYARNLTAHIADEALRTISALRAGTGQMDDKQRGKFIRALATQANHGTTPRGNAQRFESGEAAMAYMASIGAVVPDGAA